MTVLSDMALHDLDNSYRDEAVELSKFAIYTARAVIFGKEYAKREITDLLQKSTFFKLRKYMNKPLSTSEKILYKYLQMENNGVEH